MCLILVTVDQLKCVSVEYFWAERREGLDLTSFGFGDSVVKDVMGLSVSKMFCDRFI